MQEGQQRKERRSSLFVLLSALLFLKIHYQKLVSVRGPYWPGPEWWFLCPYSLPPSPHLPISALSRALSGVPKEVEPCFPSQKAAAQALISLWLCPGHMQREVGLCLWRVSCMLSGSQLWFLLEAPHAALGSSLPLLIKPCNIQGCIKPRFKDPPFSLIANKR